MSEPTYTRTVEPGDEMFPEGIDVCDYCGGSGPPGKVEHHHTCTAEYRARTDEILAHDEKVLREEYENTT